MCVGATCDSVCTAADVFALDDCALLSFASKSPRSDGRARATPENHQIKFFRLRLLKNMGGWRGLGALHATLPFSATGSLLTCIDLTRSAADAPSSASP